MASALPEREPTVRRRTLERRAAMLAAASRRFWEHGYDRVAMADVAADVGIGASALYRHFRNKQALLHAVLVESLDRFEEATDGATDIDEMIAQAASVTVRRREFGALWDRDGACLDDRERQHVRHRLRVALKRTTALLDGPPLEAQLRAQAVHAILDSATYHHTALPAEKTVLWLERAARAVLEVELSPQRASTGDPPTKPQIPVSRREALIAAATRLFGEHGSTNVGLDDVGATLGITGSAVYKHFDTKTDLVAAALTRANEVLWFGLHDAFAAVSGPRDALERALTAYVTFAVTSPHSVSMLLAEVGGLPDGQRRVCVRAQREYVAEWIGLLRRSCPGLADDEARVLVHATFAVVNVLSRRATLRARPGLTAELAAFGRAILRSTG